MANKKTYTLELTAEELLSGPSSFGYIGKLFDDKLAALQRQAKADRERDELRLPWVAVTMQDAWYVQQTPPRSPWTASERAAKLMSAAPELLEAVRAVTDTNWFREGRGPDDARQLIGRALRKVETGVPE